VADPLHERSEHPSSRRFLELLEEMLELHRSKSADYGSEADPLANIRQGAEFVGHRAVAWLHGQDRGQGAEASHVLPHRARLCMKASATRCLTLRPIACWPSCSLRNPMAEQKPLTSDDLCTHAAPCRPLLTVYRHRLPRDGSRHLSAAGRA
jgi:hypothetical protein